jgi:hypothetical protein
MNMNNIKWILIGGITYSLLDSLVSSLSIEFDKSICIGVLTITVVITIFNRYSQQ